MTYVAESYWQKRYRNFDMNASGHADLPLKYNHWLYRMKSKKILAAVKRVGVDVASARVLELGCGTGVYVDLWRSRGVKTLTGFDIAQVAADNLAKKFPEYRFYQEDLGDADLISRHSSATYTLVTAFNVLYHIINDIDFHQALRNINRLAAPGALFFITDLFVHGPEETHGYMQYRSWDNYLAALKVAGFEVLERKPVYVSMVKAVDSGNGLGKSLFNRWWSFISPYIGSRPALLGPCLYFLDVALTTLWSDGPSLELLVCKKIREVEPSVAESASQGMEKNLG
jgi:SAM-dependent methyltransferase